MEGINHTYVDVNGIKMHVAEKGEGPVVLLLHGFPELWYAWRHQIQSLASNGYRAVAPDLRGYGDTDAPASSEKYTSLHVVGDLIALLDVLGQKQVFVVGHDWGAVMAWHLCMFRPDRVKALVNLSLPFQPRSPLRKPTDALRAIYGGDYYMIRFQEPGDMEAEFAGAGTMTVLKKFLTYRSPNQFYIPKGEKIIPDVMPPWLSEEDVNYYASKYENTGFTGALNYYRALDLNWELTAPWTGAQVKVPVKFMVGDLDLSYNGTGVKEFVHGGGLKKFVPLLEDVVVMSGVGHFIQEEKPDEVSTHILDFIQKF